MMETQIIACCIELYQTLLYLLEETGFNRPEKENKKTRVTKQKTEQG